MKPNPNWGFATRQIRVGDRTNAAGSLIAPIYQTSTFVFDSVEQGGARFAGTEGGYIYTRVGNPNLTLLQEKLASLENGEAALVTASGMGAITAALWPALNSGEEILADMTLYGCTFSLLTHELPRFGVKTTLADLNDPQALAKNLTPKTKIVYLESPCNPNMRVVDIAAVAKAAHAYNPHIRVVVDNTFCTPYLQRPLDLGADVVVHSATKYLNGHGDVIAGAIISDAAFIEQCLLVGVKFMTGAVLSPFDAYLIDRGLKTLDIRMERHCANAMKVARFLAGHPAVKKVHYPGLPDFPWYEIAQRQMKLPGGMLSMELRADRETTAAALNKLKLCTVAVSLGDPETLVEHAASMTHSTYTTEELEAAGIPQGLVRVSVGLEDPDDIIADLKAVLDEIPVKG